MTRPFARHTAVVLVLGVLAGCAGPMVGGAFRQASCGDRTSRLEADLAACRDERESDAAAQAASARACRQTRAMFDVCLAEDARKELVVRELRGHAAVAAAQRDQCLREGPGNPVAAVASAADARAEAPVPSVPFAAGTAARTDDARGMVPSVRAPHASLEPLRERLAPWVGRKEVEVESFRGRLVVHMEATRVFRADSADVEAEAHGLLAALGREGENFPGSLDLIVRVRRKDLPKGPFVSLWEFAGSRAASLAHEVQFGSRLAPGKLRATGRVEDERAGPELVDVVFLPEGEDP